jgi:hypothetical protein
MRSDELVIIKDFLFKQKNGSAGINSRGKKVLAELKKNE